MTEPTYIGYIKKHFEAGDLSVLLREPTPDEAELIRRIRALPDPAPAPRRARRR